MRIFLPSGKMYKSLTMAEGSPLPNRCQVAPPSFVSYTPIQVPAKTCEPSATVGSTSSLNTGTFGRPVFPLPAATQLPVDMSRFAMRTAAELVERLSDETYSQLLSEEKPTLLALPAKFGALT